VGARSGINPNAFFDVEWYIERHPDVGASGLNPLIHYILYGSGEGRPTSASFDPSYYLRTQPDVAAAGLEPLRHFLENGRFEGRAGAGANRGREGSEFFSIISSTDLGPISSGSIEGDRERSSLVDLLPIGTTVRELPHGEHPNIDVIIPVYGGLEETRRCIESVLAHRGDNNRFGDLIIVDDCGPEPQLREYINRIGLLDGVTLLVNAKNLGFVKSVNRAMQYSKTDVVLLNADTEVNGNWLDRLAAHAKGSKVATVTAFSNNATICTFPEIGGSPDLPLGYSLEALDNAFASANLGRHVSLPTGVGFCMFVSRGAISLIGLFDETFGRGYGEETDFCQKAIKAGWVNLLAADVFVYHHGSVSFGATAAQEQMTAGEIMRGRYPDYEPSVARWIRSDPAMSMRFAALVNLIAGDLRTKILHILHPWGGGTERQVAELAASIDDRACSVVLVIQRVDCGLHLRLLVPDRQNWRQFSFDVSALNEIRKLIEEFRFDRIHVHHALEVMSELEVFIEGLGLPFDISVHDYSLVCPRNNLIDSTAKYCGEPDETGCISCLSREPEPRSRDILLWRHRGIALLEAADRVLCPSADVAVRLLKYAPHSRVLVVPHETELYNPRREYAPKESHSGERLRIAVLGVMAEHKGGAFLLECIKLAQIRRAPLQWSLIGWFPGALAERARGMTHNLHVTGPYDSKDVKELIERADPHLIFFPQHCVETYSYTLSEAFAAGRGVLVPRIGAFTERVAGVSGAWSYAVEATPSEVLDQILVLKERVFDARDERGVISPAGESAPTQVGVNADFYTTEYLTNQD
jgi:GT2 family glycosyltransferase